MVWLEMSALDWTGGCVLQADRRSCGNRWRASDGFEQ
jgi:hypothetical protein